MKRFLYGVMLAVACTCLAGAQTALVTRNVYLRRDASTNQPPITKLLPGAQLRLLSTTENNGYYRVQTAGAQTGFVWGRNINRQPTEASPATGSAPLNGAPLPLLSTGHSVDW